MRLSPDNVVADCPSRDNARRLGEELRTLCRFRAADPGIAAVLLRHNDLMVKSVEGVYRNGKVELMEPIAEAEGSRVIVTWVQIASSVDLRERGIDESQAADLRRRLATFALDWDRPEMNAYDDLPPR